MNIDAANNWPIVAAALPGEKIIQNEFTLPVSSQNHQRPAVLTKGQEIDPDKSREKGSIIDIYI